VAQELSRLATEINTLYTRMNTLTETQQQDGEA